jgi:PAS domain S-box-containing protein
MARILLVDDERGLRLTLRAFLELEGYDVQVAETAMQALELLAINGPVDVVVSDIILPKMTGLELLREIKARYPLTRVILITGEPTVSTAATAVRSGAFDYLDKPITRDRLLQVVKLAVETSPDGFNVPLSPDENTQSLMSHGFDQLPDVLWEMDLNFKYTYISPAIERMRGYSVKEVMTQTPKDVMTTESAERIEQILQDELMRDLGEKQKEPRIRTIELDLRHRDGRTIPAEVVVTFVRDEVGQPVGIMGITRDISARRQDQRRALENISINEHMHRMESLARLSSGLAHDFNNLLTSVSGNAALAIMDAQGNQAALESLEEIRIAAERAGELTNILLEFSQRQTQRLLLTDIGALVSRVLQKYAAIFGQERRLVVELPESIHRAKIDLDRFEICLYELMDNSAAAIEPGGTVTISLSSIFLEEEQARFLHLPHTGEYIVLAVRDNGCGISVKDLPYVFEPYFTTKPKGESKGLGLARVYGNIRQMGGGLNIVSEVGLGTTVELYVPREYLGEAAETFNRIVKKEGAMSGTETILCVDDDDIARDVAARALKRYGYRVLEAADGLEALHLAEVFQGPIHLLLTDLIMPRLGGEACAKGVVALKPETRVLFISGFSEKPIDFNASSPVEFLSKPFDAPTLLSAVRRVLDK